MKHLKILISLLMMAISLSLSAQEEKLRVAVFDPTSSGTGIDEGTQMAVRELISSTFVNTGKYMIVERSLLQQVMKEQKFSNTDVVDDSQATELGRLAGANKVVLSVVTLVGGRNMLSIKVIDVKTATVDQQKTKIVNTNDLLDAVEPLSLELIGVQSSIPAQPQKQIISTPPNQQAAPAPQPVSKPVNAVTPPPVVNNAVVRAVTSFINQDLEEKINRYRTDEERLGQVKADGKLKELIKFSTKFAVPPKADENQVTFFCPSGDKKDIPLFLFMDGKMIGVGTIEKGLSAIIQNDGASHLITVWKYSDKIYSTTVSFVQKTEYRFTWNGKNIQL